MLKRIGAAAALLLVLQAGAVGQTMRFTTNVGSFDMVLNPTNDANLQPLVDNIVAYIGLGRYHFSALNRAADGDAGTSDDFVLQMGGFMGFPPLPDLWATMNTSIETFNDGVVVDADGDGQVDFTSLSNTRGTVSMALQSGQPNSGTSSFFVNLGDNNFLDSQGFVPFARIENMGTIDQIMQLTQTDLSDEIGQSGNLAFSDVPLTDAGRLVVVKDVSVIDAAEDFSFVGPIASALQIANRGTSAVTATSTLGSEAETLGALLADEGVATLESSPPAASAVPEPSTVALGLAGMFATLLAARRRRG